MVVIKNDGQSLTLSEEGVAFPAYLPGDEVQIGGPGPGPLDLTDLELVLQDGGSGVPQIASS